MVDDEADRQIGSRNAATSRETSSAAKLARWVSTSGVAAFTASIAGAQLQLPEWIWVFKVAAAVAAAFCLSGAIFVALDHLNWAVRETPTRIVNRALLIFALAIPLLCFTALTVFRFPPVTRLFDHPAEPSSNRPKPEPPPAREEQDRIPVPPPTPVPPSTPVPPPRTGAQPSDFLSLYGGDPVTICGQPRLSARQSVGGGWVLYSTDTLSNFQEQPLVEGQGLKVGNCRLVLKTIESAPLRFDFDVYRDK